MTGSKNAPRVTAVAAIDILMKGAWSGMRSTIESKQKWNSDHYTQIKVSVPKDLAAEFKEKCKASNVAMASVIKKAMSGFCGQKAQISAKTSVGTRQQRRKAVALALSIVEDASLAESRYLDAIPANLRNSSRFENAEASVCAYEEAVQALEGIYE